MGKRGRKKQFKKYEVQIQVFDKIIKKKTKPIIKDNKINELIMKRTSALSRDFYKLKNSNNIFYKILNQCINKPKNDKKDIFLIFDFETDAILVENNFMQQRPIQLAWQICDSDGTIIERKNIFIKGCKRLGFFWNDKKYYTLDTINKYGKDIKDVILSFIEQLKKIYMVNGFIVGHNISFDLGVLKYTVNKLLNLKDNEKKEYNEIMDIIKTRRICTMHKTRKWFGTMQIESFTSDGKHNLSTTAPPMKLSVLYNLLYPDCPQDELNYHRADFDTEITKKCLIKYLKVSDDIPQNIIKTNNDKIKINTDDNMLTEKNYYTNYKVDKVNIENKCITYKNNVLYPTIKNSMNNNLHSIILKNCTKVGDISLNIIGQSCKKLLSLNLEKCSLITNLGIYFIKDLDLQCLNINDCCKISSRCFNYLKYIPLNKLYLRNCERIKNNDIYKLKYIPLIEIDVSGSNIDIKKNKKYLTDVNIINKKTNNKITYYSDSDIDMSDDEIDDDHKSCVIKYVLPEPSKKQKNIVDTIKTHNVKIDSVAGSGKTTTILHIASNLKNMKILVLTYNKRLKIDSRSKIELLKLKNIEVHSYHSFCVKHYHTNCHTDYGLMSIIHDNTIPKKNFKYDMIIIDESQDINNIYYSVICKIIYNNKQIHPRICITGDACQTIYEYNGADSRYLTNAEKILNNNSAWKTIIFNESFRVTNEIALFINNCIYDYDKIIAYKKGSKPRYLMTTTYVTTNVYNEIKNYLKTYKYSDIFVLAPSIKNHRASVKRLANKLSKEGIPIYIPNTDDDVCSNDKVLQNKIIFSTFHQVKGLERKVVIIYNFDDSYFKYYARDLCVNKCPNALYVAMTRASEKLTLIHSTNDKYLPFLNIKKINKYCEVIKYSNLKISKNDPEYVHSYEYVPDRTVTDLLSHLPANIIKYALEFINIEEISKKKEKIFIKGEMFQKMPDTKQLKLYEMVSDITGNAIPLYFEKKISGKISILSKVKEILKNEYISDYITKKFNINIPTLDIKRILYISNVYTSYKNRTYHRLKQITNYDWISEKDIQKCYDRLSKHITKNAKFECESCVKRDKQELHNTELKGRFDCIDGNKIWEFKFVNEIKPEHILQLALYMYMSMNDTKYNTKNYTHYLFNIFDDQILKISITKDNLSKLVNYIISHKLEKNIKTDNEFMNNALTISNKYKQKKVSNKSPIYIKSKTI
jgi:hypothetical protein